MERGLHGTAATASDTDTRPDRTDRAAVAVLLTLTFALRVVEVFRYRIDSDEPQHLHVAWAWTRGLLQYRDVFDNHAPLFHMLYAPLVAALGERPDIVFLMRLAVFPLYVLALGAVYAIARALYSPRVALWTAALAGLMPGFVLTSLEFRTDDLWAALWLLALAVLVGGRPTVGRAAGAGLLLGTAVGVSMKTTLLVVALAVAATGTLVLTAGRRPALGWRALAVRAAALAGGLAVVPVALLGFFAFRGALAPFLYGTVAHNIVPGLGQWQNHPWRPLLLPIALPPLWGGAHLLVRRAPTAELGARRALVFLAAGVFLVALFGCWPLVTREDFLPVAPLAPLLVAPLLEASLPLAQRRRGRSSPEVRQSGASLTAGYGRERAARLVVPLLAAALELLLLVRAAPPWQRHWCPETALLGDVLRLTRVDDYVMDLKGEAVFRQRPFYWVLERITKTRLERGLIADSIPERLIATRTPVVVPDGGSLPPRGRAFMNAHYLPAGQVRVLGQFLADAARPVSRTISFEVVIPASYAIVADHGDAAGSLDGTPYGGARYLAAGRHEFDAYAGDGRFALVWAPALERGFSPFAVEGASG